MVHARQESEWAHTMALIATVGNLFAKKGSAVSIKPFIPAHLLRESATTKRPEREPTPEEVAANWAAIRVAFLAGRAR